MDSGKKEDPHSSPALPHMSSSSVIPSQSNASTAYEVARLLKLPENRLCADCSAPLFGVTSTFASLEFGVWICTACAEMHKEELSSLSSSSPWILPKPANSTWTTQELLRMQTMSQPTSFSKDTNATQKIATLAGNVSRNKILERYIPDKVWKKISPTSGTGLRRTWIRAKYYSHYFSIPHYDLEQDSRFLMNNPEFNNNNSVHSISSIASSLLKDDRKARIDAQKVLPTRLIDYFLILGPTKIQLMNANKSSPEKSPNSPTASSALSWMDLRFAVDTVDCYPTKDTYSDTPIPELIAPMVFPGGACLSKVEKQPFSFTYVLTDINRIKLYGASMIIYELVDPEQLKTWVRQYIASHYKHMHNLDEWQALLDSTEHPVLYIPKALTILSHYPFHTLFQAYLGKLYHISLSTSPLPLERYVINLVQEVPLPPQGKIEVLVTLPGALFSISRPPINQLPMVDFSYRPLFASLSVDHILQIFACLSLERSVCICASNIALLTPIQEALLSFLFPFVWQGCYVPMLPTHLMELLDAPVPLLVGMHDDYLKMTPPELRPSGVLFVHVDTDTVMFGERDLEYMGEEDSAYIHDPYGQELGHKLPALPKAQAAKLRAKLMEYGASLYKQCDWLLKQAGNPFPHQEHYTPIETQLFQEQGLVLSHPQTSIGGSGGSGVGGGSLGGGGLTGSTSGASGTIGTSWMMKNTQLGIRSSNVSVSSHLHGTGSGSGIAGSGHGQGIPYRHPASCTVITPTSTKEKEQQYHQTVNRVVTNILDAQNNILLGDETFNAREIREAFLRFWVASLGDYNDYFVRSNDDGSIVWSGHRAADRRKTLFGSVSSKMETGNNSNNSNNNNNPATLKIGMDGIDGHEPGEDVFLTKFFAQNLSNAFLSAMITGQMFSTFRNEKLENRKAMGENHNKATSEQWLQPEIRFFDEHIQAKRNRSKLTLTKASTPFLSDESFFLREIYNVPSPSMNGLDPNATFSYSFFPNKLNMTGPENKGYLLRKPRLLVETPEVKRFQDDAQAVAFLKQTLITLQQQQRSYNVSVSVSGKENASPFLNNPQLTNNANNTKNEDSLDNDPIAFFRNCRLKFLRTLEGIVKLQAYVRRRPLYRQFHKQQFSAQRIVRFYKAKRIARWLWKKKVTKEAILLQRQVRRWLAMRRYRIIGHLIRWMQASGRARRQRLLYLRQRRALIAWQARIRGVATRRDQATWLRETIHSYRQQVVYLWVLEHTSLRYRALFWRQVYAHRYVTVALYQEELTRLYQALHCTKLIPTFPTDDNNHKQKNNNNNGVPSPNIFNQQFQLVQTQFPPLQELMRLMLTNRPTETSSNEQTNAYYKALIPQVTEITRKYFIRNHPSLQAKFEALLAQETQDRDQLYQCMKRSEDQHHAVNFTQLFSKLNIDQRHKRKRKLAHYVWMSVMEESDCDVSADIVLTVLPANYNAGKAPTANATSENSFWLEQKLQQRMRRHCVETVHACLVSLQRVKKQQTK